MNTRSRRDFIGDISRGMLVAGVGAAVATDMGFSPAFADQGTESLSFGAYQPLVDLMREQAPDKLQEILVNKLQRGESDLRQLVASAALANAETFGGQDYVGYHVEMALVPALEMAERLPEARRPLPVLKVLYRNCQQIQSVGGKSKVTLRPVDIKRTSEDRNTAGQGSLTDTNGAQLRKAVRATKMDQAEQVFASLCTQSQEKAYNQLQATIRDDVNVHRFVLAHRTWELVPIVGEQFAHAVLRQCVRYCVDTEQVRINKETRPSPIRQLLPRLMDQYSLENQPKTTKEVDNAWLEEMSQLIFQSDPETACDAVAAALAEGVSIEDVGQSISLAANLLVLRQHDQNWRTHGDAAGVHASDAANAWRNMGRVVSHRNATAGMIVAAFHTSRYGGFNTAPYPLDSHLEATRKSVKRLEARALLRECDEAIQANDQGRAAAAIQIYGELGFDPQPVFQRLLNYAISEDGRLHGEKFYQTVAEEFAVTRPAFRWRYLAGLARVTASSYGYDRFDKKGFRAPGYDQARKLLGV